MKPLVEFAKAPGSQEVHRLQRLGLRAFPPPRKVDENTRRNRAKRARKGTILVSRPPTSIATGGR